MRRSVSGIVLAGLLIAAAGCKEEGTVRVHSLNFKGVQAVDVARLRGALATRQSDRLPWGKKAFFDRARFDADLKRIQAFYADRGYPDARMTGFDVKLNDKQDSDDITITIAEGEPVKVAAINFVGFDDVIPAAHLDTLKNQTPLKVGAPRDRQLVVTTHELALNEQKDHGYPYAKVDTGEDDGPDGKSATITFSAAPGKIAHIGSIEIQGNKTVSARVIERELTFKTGDLYQRGVLQDSQRRLYGLELFQFANIEPLNPELQPTEVPIRITVAEGKHQRVNFGVGYGTEEKARVDAEYHHVNFLGDARLAGAHAFDPGNVPFSKKYFLGGATSLRGWGRYEISPLSDSGLPIGGNSLLSFSEELRADLRGKLGAVVFLDGGNVWAESWGVNVSDLRYAVGPGLRYQTPVGPIRFDVGYQLNPISELRVNGQPQQRRWRIHFSIGPAF